MRAPKTSAFHGVAAVTRSGHTVFVACLYTGGVAHYLGRWPEERDAALAIDRAALHFGVEPPNFPENARAGQLSASTPERLRDEARARYVKTSGSSRFVGVSKRRDGRYRSQVSVPGEQRTLAIGVFDSEEEAAVAHDRVALALGDAVHLNFPDRSLSPATIEEIRREVGAKLPEDASSRYRGVYWRSLTRKWHAEIKVDKVRWTLGRWDRERCGDRLRSRGALSPRRRREAQLPAHDGRSSLTRPDQARAGGGSQCGEVQPPRRRPPHGARLSRVRPIGGQTVDHRDLRHRRRCGDRP